MGENFPPLVCLRGPKHVPHGVCLRAPANAPQGASKGPKGKLSSDACSPGTEARHGAALGHVNDAAKRLLQFDGCR